MPSPRGSRVASRSRGLSSGSRVAPASVSQDDTDSVTEPESDCHRVPTDYGDSEPEDDANGRSQDTGVKRKRTAREDEKTRKWEEQMQSWPEYF